ncbi:opacity protein-like surface antigen [Rhodopseudomonas rhenobacensis]|uniref:Opacity protein-like surface antigen n=1 Tax=Rhodopseudomonas rhenobacensis TaxID=87461 RepID=A0A7W7Z301_9BRAD|nr:outer membrane beta-barrel protein [Rhodopseudomonas rhenobacensis]MBB5047095.1 opacity protein-like surface antigen [Rhodopseudomonas rhenobacensis]
MRRLVVGAMLLTVAQAASSADMPFLRGALSDGPRRVVDWEGFYVGGQASYGTIDTNFTDATRGLAEQAMTNTLVNSAMQVSDWPTLGKQSAHGQGYGGFVGYNWQWTDVVLGLEANYIHGKFDGSDSNVSNPITRCMGLSDSLYHCAAYRSAGSIVINDLGSARARAGWAVGSFLPYMFGGVSLGQADIVRSASIRDTLYTASPALGGTYVGYNQFDRAKVQNGHFIYGYSAGLGIDMMLFSGLFVRAEWEYLKFAAPVDTSVSTVRAGLGYKF